MHDTEPDSPVSRSARKREAEALQALGEQIIRLPAAQFAELPLPDELRAAMLTARDLTRHGALRRQRQYVGKLMRNTDVEPIRAALARLQQSDAAATARLHQLEHWRERLLAEGDAALTELLDLHPAADRQQLRQLIRSARQEQTQGQPPRHARELFRYLRGLLETP